MRMNAGKSPFAYVCITARVGSRLLQAESSRRFLYPLAGFEAVIQKGGDDDHHGQDRRVAPLRF
jgi:hypothetical protein